MSEKNGKIIELSDLTKKFKSLVAVNNFSIDVKQGQIVGFVGPNGAGKTTTISMLLGFIKASSGTAKILGKTIKPENAHLVHKNVGYVAGDMALFDNLTGQQYLDFFANQNSSKANRQDLVNKLKPQLNVKIKNLSRGNKQKIALVSALQHSPNIIILDEPTSGLDPLMQKTFLEIIENEAKNGATVFMSSHILSEVAEVSDRVIFMRDGQIIFDKTTQEITALQGKNVQLTAENNVIEQLVENLLSGSAVTKKSKKDLHFTFKGSPELLIKWMAKHQLTDFSVKNESLEDMFEELYSKADSK